MAERSIPKDLQEEDAGDSRWDYEGIMTEVIIGTFPYGKRQYICRTLYELRFVTRISFCCSAVYALLVRE